MVAIAGHLISGYTRPEGLAGDGPHRHACEPYRVSQLSAEIEIATELACAAPVA